MPTWQTNVTPAAAVGGPQGSLDPTDPESRYKLVVDIQQQLKRVGCYWGRVNGSWNNNTREAMRSFTTTTNAALPVEKPDYLLLSLLKSHNGRSCGAPETTTAAARRRNLKCCRGRPGTQPSPQHGSIRRCRTASCRPSRSLAAWQWAGRESSSPPRRHLSSPAARLGSRGCRHRRARAWRHAAAGTSTRRLPPSQAPPGEEVAPPRARNAALQSDAEPRRRLLIAAVVPLPDHLPSFPTCSQRKYSADPPMIGRTTSAGLV